ncbi:MAG: hypothetical protein ACOCUI_05105 [bacterium]
MAQTALAINGITNLFKIFSTTIGKGGLLGALSKLALFLGGGSIVAGFLIITAIIGLMIVAWQKDIGGFKDFISNTFGIIFDIIKDVFSTIWKVVNLIFGGIGDLLAGNFEEGIAKITLAILEFVKFLQRVFVRIGAILINIIILAVNIIKNLILGAVQYIVDKFLNMFKKLDSFLGEYSPFGGIISGLENFTETLDKAKNANIPSLSKDLVNNFIAKNERGYDFLEGMIKTNAGLPENTGDTSPLDSISGVLSNIKTLVPGTNKTIAGTTEQNNIINYAPNYNLTASGDKEIKRLLEEQSKKTLEDMKSRIPSSFNIS